MSSSDIHILLRVVDPTGTPAGQMENYSDIIHQEVLVSRDLPLRPVWFGRGGRGGLEVWKVACYLSLQ